MAAAAAAFGRDSVYSGAKYTLHTLFCPMLLAENFFMSVNYEAFRSKHNRSESLDFCTYSVRFETTKYSVSEVEPLGYLVRMVNLKQFVYP
jgi:hypothetical protein